MPQDIPGLQRKGVSVIEDPLGFEVQTQYEASYLDKQAQGIHDNWAMFEDYWAGNQNPKRNNEHPGSVTNIILPNIESMISDLVMEPLEILLEGWTISDRRHAPRAQMALEWVWKKNRMTPKRDKHERHRLKFGTGIWKVYFDGQGHGRIGMPIIEPVNPANFFPDPKIQSYDQLNLGEYVIHAVVRPLPYLKRIYGSVVNRIQPNAFPAYDPSIFGNKAHAIEAISKNKVLVLERWTIDEDTGRLRKVVVADGITLYDSKKDTTGDRDKKGYYRINRYPFVMVPCYPREGSLWGMGDVELLIPTQDLVNDLDDQIRMNARLMGNIQKVIAVSSGINPNLWTNEAGINVPARDVNGFRIVEPPNMPPYIINRRTQAMTYEAQVLTGRSDVVEGRNPGSIRAASAILTLQEAGLRRVNHKKLMAQEGLNSVFSIVLDYITHYWTEEHEIGEDLMALTGREEDKGRPVMFRGSELNEIPILQEDGTPLLDEQGQPMTKRADFDIHVNIGTGIATNKNFIYQATTELAMSGLISREEGRAVLKQVLGWPLIDPYNPQGEFITGQQGQQSQSAGPAGMLQNPIDVASEIPPDLLMELVQRLGGGGGMI